MQMKKAIQLAVILLAFLPAISFAQAKKITWPEMEKFHTIMAATFHPTEEGNYAPLKEKSGELFQAAKAWQKSTIPANFRQAETKDGLRMLVIKCAAVDKAVQAKQTDEKLKPLIGEAHDAFHHIAGECRKE